MSVQAERPVLVIGGAGFVGTNLADALLEDGERVVILDNFSCRGVHRNVRQIRRKHGDRVRVVIGDVRDPRALRREIAGASAVFHLAAQVTVNASLVDPLHDFDVNARGTLHVLEALRELSDPPPLLFASTSKVYGALEDVPIEVRGARYEPVDEILRRQGIGETRPLDFRSPLACSKGAADQYVLDAGRTFGLRTIVFRMSSTYGPHQVGTEDHGWVSHFVARAIDGDPITVFGDGRQVRDVLFVDDLVRALRLAMDSVDRLAGCVFNVGGGAACATSVLELIALLRVLRGSDVPHHFERSRPGEQRYYVSDTSRLERATGWRPAVSVEEGVRRLWDWLQLESRAAAPALLGSPP